LKEAKEGFMNSRESRAVIGHLTASVDIDNDGKPEQVYFDQACHSLFGSVLIVLTDGLDDLDFKKTDSLLIHPDWKTLKKNITARQPKDVHTDPSRASALVNSLYGVFIYHGKSYFDYAWYPSDLIAGAADPKDVTTKIQVFIDESGKTSEVCRLQLNMFAQ
jgi:hypothetical protein